MLLPSITSMSSAQADGQSCGQVEWRMSTLACWFMPRLVTSNSRVAERLYLGLHRRNQRPCHALRAEIGPAIGVDRLPVDVARARPAEEAHHGRDVVRAAP